MPLRGASQAELFVGFLHKDLAVDEPVVKVFSRGDRVAEDAFAAELDSDLPARLANEDPRRQDRFAFVFFILVPLAWMDHDDLPPADSRFETGLETLGLDFAAAGG